MKHRIILRAIACILILSLMSGMTACSNHRSTAPSQSVTVDEPAPSEAELAIEAALKQYGEENEEETALLNVAVSLSDDSVSELYEQLDTLDVIYPYADIVNLLDSYDRYLSMKHWEDGTDYGALSRFPLKEGELFDIVKTNNDDFLSEHTIANSLYSPLDDEYLEWVCQVLTDTLNRELSEWDFGTQLDSIDWIIANLKVLKGSTTSNASVTKGAIMQVRKSGADGMVAITGNESAAEMTITHEVEHLLQSMSTPGMDALGLDQAYGFCYSWADLPVNALHTSWFIEASAEKLASYFYDTEPSTYLSMIGYLDSLTVIAALRGVEPIEVPRLSQQGSLETVFDLFGRETEEEQIEFLNLLYAIELIQQSPDDFWSIYTEKTGLEQTDENLIEVQRNLKAAACLTMSRMFYENLSQLLVENSITMRELFYLIYTWEFDLSYHLVYDDETRLHNTGVFLEGYTAIQAAFFSTLANNLSSSAEDLTELYNAAHCRARVPETSMLHGDEIWDAEDIAPFSRKINDFWDSYYQTVSSYKTVPVSVAAEILLDD